MEAFEDDPAAFIEANGEFGPDPWLDFQELVAMCVEDDTVKGIAMDTVDVTFEACQESVCARRGILNPSDLKDYGATWNEIKHEFTSTFRAAGDHGLSMLFISHAKEREQEFMDGVEGLSLVGPSCSASCMKIMKQVCDFWMYYGYDGGKRTVWTRDSTSSLDVAAGTGFLDGDGNEINKVLIPKDPHDFYPALNAAYKGGQKAKPVIAKPKKKLPK